MISGPKDPMGVTVITALLIQSYYLYNKSAQGPFVAVVWKVEHNGDVY